MNLIQITVLTQTQYCIIRNPIGVNGKPEFGRQQIRRGECKFFLQPGEALYKGIQNIHVIDEDEALLVRANVNYFDKKTEKEYKAGQRWLIKGPTDYIPENEVDIVEKREAQPLAENEGLYVRDL